MYIRDIVRNTLSNRIVARPWSSAWSAMEGSHDGCYIVDGFIFGNTRSILHMGVEFEIRLAISSYIVTRDIVSSTRRSLCR